MTWEEINAAVAEKLAAVKAAVKTEGLDEKARQTATNEAVAGELGNLLHEARQFLHDGGHRMATATNAAKLQAAEEAKRTLEAARQALEAQVQEHKAKIAEIEGKTPDVERVKRQLLEDFAKIEGGLKAQVEAAQAEVGKLQEARRADHVDGFVSRLRGRLGSVTTEDGADWIGTRLERMRLDGRFLPKDAEAPFKVAVLRPGSPDLEYHATNEEELLSVVATEVLEAAPKWAVKAQVKGGGGAGPAGTGGAANKWDKIREEARARNSGGQDEELAKRRAKLVPQG